MFICSLHIIIAPKPGYYFPALILNIIDDCFNLKASKQETRWEFNDKFNFCVNKRGGVWAI